MTEGAKQEADATTDFGKPAQIIFEDFDSETYRAAQVGLGAVWNVGTSAGEAQYRVKLLARRGLKNVEDVWILRTTDDTNEYQTVLHLHGGAAERLVALMRNNAFDAASDRTPPVGNPAVLPDAHALAAAYEHDPAALRALIAGDTNAADVVAVAHRKSVVAEFRRMIDDDSYFDEKVAKQARQSTEGVWQEFLEVNPWLLGLNLSAHLFVSWDSDRLEKVVAGYDVGGAGKRADALMRTAGAVRLLTFAEIKHHRTDLVGKRDYRSGCWAPSEEVTGAVAQSHGTMQLAVEKHGEILRERDEQGFAVPGGEAYLYRPRAYVVVGQLAEFVSESGGHHQEKIRSFELYRRNLQTPEVITFDELLARAEALVDHLDSQTQETTGAPNDPPRGV